MQKISPTLLAIAITALAAGTQLMSEGRYVEATLMIGTALATLLVREYWKGRKKQKAGAT